MSKVRNSPEIRTSKNQKIRNQKSEISVRPHRHLQRADETPAKRFSKGFTPMESQASWRLNLHGVIRPNQNPRLATSEPRKNLGDKNFTHYPYRQRRAQQAKLEPNTTGIRPVYNETKRSPARESAQGCRRVSPSQRKPRAHSKKSPDDGRSPNAPLRFSTHFSVKGFFLPFCLDVATTVYRVGN